MTVESKENEPQKRYSKPCVHASVRVLLVFVLLVFVFCAGWGSHRIYAIVQSEIAEEQQFQEAVQTIRETFAGQASKKTVTGNQPSPPNRP